MSNESYYSIRIKGVGGDEGWKGEECCYKKLTAYSDGHTEF